MATKIVEDRTLARVAYEVAGAIDPQCAAMGIDIAVGQAIVMLRVMGVAAGPEIVRTVRADIEGIVGRPAEMSRARAIAMHSEVVRRDFTPPPRQRLAAAG